MIWIGCILFISVIQVLHCCQPPPLVPQGYSDPAYYNNIYNFDPDQSAYNHYSPVSSPTPYAPLNPTEVDGSQLNNDIELNEDAGAQQLDFIQVQNPNALEQEIDNGYKRIAPNQRNSEFETGRAPLVFQPLPTPIAPPSMSENPLMALLKAMNFGIGSSSAQPPHDPFISNPNSKLMADPKSELSLLQDFERDQCKYGKFDNMSALLDCMDVEGEMFSGVKSTNINLGKSKEKNPTMQCNFEADEIGKSSNDGTKLQCGYAI
ncbi:hypothetical protein DdX_06774 [Ditylenchus destructor]|uniref:Uncharacterized protein n=1 Tax=Ditylenchus destructor TaxID=166010 RepID=A0AAD4N922_9BILA|nr:hypothetical protein DdX_06774 [Ditylenchus destructor]